MQSAVKMSLIYIQRSCNKCTEILNNAEVNEVKCDEAGKDGRKKKWRSPFFSTNTPIYSSA